MSIYSRNLLSPSPFSKIKLCSSHSPCLSLSLSPASALLCSDLHLWGSLTHTQWLRILRRQHQSELFKLGKNTDQKKLTASPQLATHKQRTESFFDQTASWWKIKAGKPRVRQRSLFRSLHAEQRGSLLAAAALTNGERKPARGGHRSPVKIAAAWDCSQKGVQLWR